MALCVLFKEHPDKSVSLIFLTPDQRPVSFDVKIDCLFVSFKILRLGDRIPFLKIWFLKS